MKRSGFTLVELLVVIAIIALLISILSPSLKTAKDLAKQTICSTRIHSVCQAGQIYAEMNRGMLPVLEYGRRYQAPGPTDTSRTYKLLSDNNPDYLDDAKTILRAWGPLGIMLNSKNIESPDLIYCPLGTNARNDFFRRDTYPDPYGYHCLSKYTSNLRAGYMFNIHASEISPGFWEMDYKAISDLPPGKVLVADVFFRDVDVGHMFEPPTWNRGFGDGHVATKSSAAGYKYLIDMQGYCFESWPMFNVGVKNYLDDQ